MALAFGMLTRHHLGPRALSDLVVAPPGCAHIAGSHGARP